MSQPLFYLQALLALLTFFGSAWFLLNTKRFGDSLHTGLVGAIGLAATGYLICRIGLDARLLQIEEVARLEKASTTFLLIAATLFPCSISRAIRSRLSPILLVIGTVGFALLVANLRSDFSLRLDLISLAVPESTDQIIRTREPSTWVYALAAFILFSAAHTLSISLRISRERSRRSAVVVSIIVLVFLGAFGFDFVGLVSEGSRWSTEWIGVSCLALCSFAWRFAFRAEVADPLLEMRASEHPVEPAPVPNPNEDEPLELDPDAAAEKVAALVEFPDEDGELVSKLLNSKGFVVVRIEGDLESDSTQADDLQPEVLVVDFDTTKKLPPNLAAFVKKSAKSPHIVAYSQDADDPHIRREARTQGMSTLLPKPPKARELFKALESLKSRQSGQPGSQHSNLYR